MANTTWWTRVHVAVFIAIVVMVLASPSLTGVLCVLGVFALTVFNMWMDNWSVEDEEEEV